MTCVRPPWRIELCPAKCFGLLLCLTIFLATRMAEITSIPQFDPFEQTGSVGPRWDRWKTRLQYYIDARGTQTRSATSPCRVGCFRHLRYLIRHWDHLHGGAKCAEHSLLSSEELTIRKTHVSPGSSSTKRINCSIRYTTKPTGRAL